MNQRRPMKAPNVPPPDSTTAGWWEATEEHRLTVQECTACGTRQHPPRELCTGCGDTTRLRLADAAGTGAVDSYTVVHRASMPDLDVPYVIARVRLDEGPVVLTRLEGVEPDAWRIGDRIAVDWVDLPDGRALPIFVPAIFVPAESRG